MCIKPPSLLEDELSTLTISVIVSLTLSTAASILFNNLVFIFLD